MTKNKYVIFDLDDTLCDLATPLSVALQLYIGKYIPPHMWLTYDLSQLYDISRHDLLDLFRNTNVTQLAKPRDAAQGVVHYAKYYGYKPLIITARGSFCDEYESWRIKLWLNTYGFPLIPTIITTAEEKAYRIANLDNPTYLFVDDRLDTCKAVRKNTDTERVFLMTRPWNAKERVPKNITRIYELDELIPYLQQKEVANAK
jgi:hypothetical protein